MAKALFFNIPFHGHTYPTLPLVAELVQRGEHVIYYSSETFRPAIEQAGATFRGVDAFLNEQTPVDENLVRFSYTLIRTTQEIIPAILLEVKADHADYILYDSLCVWGKCLAQILRVPAISSVTTLVPPRSFLNPDVLPSLPALLPEMMRSLFEGRRELAQFQAITKQLHETYHIPRPRLSGVYNNLAELNIVYSTKQLQIYLQSFDESFKFAGPFIGRRSEAPVFPFEELGNEPVIYISLGTVFNDKAKFYRLCFEAFADLDARVVMSVGSKTDIARLGTIPSNYIVKPFVPQLQLLEHAALFITHSGMNSVSEGLWAGVPLLMIPQAADQRFIARHVQGLGAGKMLDKTKLNAQGLRKVAEEMLAQPAFQCCRRDRGVQTQAWHRVKPFIAFRLTRIYPSSTILLTHQIQDRGTTTMATHPAAAADYRRELGGGLLQRWSAPEDTENIAQLCGFVFRDREDEPLTINAIEAVRLQMSGHFPWMGPGDYAVIEDTNRQGNRLVACTCLWRLEWEYEGIPFGVGQPEYVVTLPEYRNRGLIRTLFQMVHARSEAEGHLAQAITGILNFYRQFGYEYALELEGRRVTYLPLIPKAKESAPEPYSLRQATPEDIPLLLELYDLQHSTSMVWNITSEQYWRYYIEEDADARVSGKNMCVRMIVDMDDKAQGYLLLATRRRSQSLNVYALNISAGISWHEVAPSLLRALQTYGIEIPAVGSDVPPLDEISFWLGSYHPIYDVLGETMAPYYEPPYAWYVRVPDMLAFVRHIAPVLEKRLANSAAANYSGEFTIDFFRGGMRFIFEKGCITRVEPWRAPAYKNTAEASCPTLVFLQLLFGYRSLDELRYAFPDVRVENSNAALLLNTLFPKKFSWVIG